MEKKGIHSNKDFASSKGRAIQIGKKDPLFYRRNFDEKLENLKKIYYQAIESRSLWTGPKAIVLEGEWTDNLKGLVHIGNSAVTKSISYRLAEGDEKVDAVERQK